MEVENLAADDASALLEQISQPEKPMEQSAPTQAETPATPKTFKLKVRDQEFEKPEPEMLSLAQKGLDYEMNNRLLRQERELFELKQKEFQTKQKDIEGYDPERFKELRELDDYSRKNPKFLEMVKSQYQQIATGKTEPTSEGHPLLDKVKSMEQEIAGLKTFTEQQKAQKEDQALDTSIKDLKAKNPEINWDEKDQFGYTIEHRVLKHLTDNNFPTVRSAFLDLFGEKIISAREQKAAERVAKDIEDRSKKGFVLNKRLASLNTYKPKSSTEESYDDIAQRSIKELGL